MGETESEEEYESGEENCSVVGVWIYKKKGRVRLAGRERLVGGRVWLNKEAPLTNVLPIVRRENTS